MEIILFKYPKGLLIKNLSVNYFKVEKHAPVLLLLTENSCKTIALTFFMGNLFQTLLSEKTISVVPTEVLIEKFCLPQYQELFRGGIENFNYYEFTKQSNLREYATIGEYAKCAK